VAVTGAQLSGVTIASRGITVMGYFNQTAGNGVVLGMENGGRWYLYWNGTGVEIGGDVSTTNVAPTIQNGQTFFGGVVISAAGVMRGFIGSPRAGGGVAVIFSAAAAGNVTSFSAPLCVKSFNAGGSFLFNGSAEGITYFNTALTDPQIIAAAQISQAPWAGGPRTKTPTGASGYWPLLVHTNLTDQSGNALAAFVAGGAIATTASIQQPAVPGTLAANLVCSGDSITHGFPGFPTSSYPLTLAGLRPTDTVTNAGQDGAQWSDTLTRASTDLVGHWDPAKCNIAIDNTGLNDIDLGQSAASTLAEAQSVINTQQAYGWTVIMLSPIPASIAAGPLIELATYRTTSLTLGDGAIDNGTDAYYQLSNPAIYADTKHLTPAGYAHMAGNINTGITSFYATFSGGGGSSTQPAVDRGRDRSRR
jgi:hypothetical protein